MEKFYNRIGNLKLRKKEIKSALFLFSKKEWKIFVCLALILFVTTLIILQKINRTFMIDVPTDGGSISEGIVGSPRFINPILALSDADRDLVALIYSGLMRKDPEGNLIPDMAQSYEISKDGLTYKFILKDKIYFQDGKPVTADDVVFTINEIKDPIIKSPYRANWDGVTVQKLDEKTIQFSLKQSYASFLENTTLGIMPTHVWGVSSSIELNNANVNPIGSGPYEVKKVSKNSDGLINYYQLIPFNKFILGKPYISKITLNFYPNENDLMSAIQGGKVEQVSSITPADAELLKQKGYRIESSVMPRVFGLFFNQNQAQIFTDKNVVKAIDQAIDKDKIVREVLDGYGVIIDDPIPPNMINYQKLNSENNDSHEKNLQKARDMLAKDGWKKGDDGILEKTTVVKKKKTVDRLEFTISTGNAIELAKSSELIQQDLESIGIKVDVKTYEIGNLNQTIIRPRKYDALLFGQIINHESDLFAFWHSSQRKDPGLNVAMYTNAKVDKILEDAFITINEKERIKKYAQFENEIQKDLPAIFLYSPDFIYVVSKNLEGISIDHIVFPADRFLNSYQWYVNVDSIWKIFKR